MIREQQGQWLGKALLAPSLPHRLFTLFAVVAGLAVILLLYFGDYTRKERITGRLVPQQGLVQVYTPQSGIIVSLNADIGSVVDMGESLLTISSDRQSELFGATQEEIALRLARRRDSLLYESTVNMQIFEQELHDTDQQIVEATAETTLREQELSVQRERIALSEAKVARLATGYQSGAVSREQWLNAKDIRLEQLMVLRGLERELAATVRKKLTLESRLSALPLDLKKSRASLERQMDTLEQELAETESRRELILTAPEAGTVTAVQVRQGNSVLPQTALLSILPAGSVLEARLYVPTRAIGFLEDGQQVLLRYKAFPYQKFGHHKGTITRIARSTVRRGDTSLQSNANTPGLSDEPVYLVTVALNKQSVEAYGKAIALQPGMEFEADILLESRRLFEWVLEPLYTLTGSIRT